MVGVALWSILIGREALAEEVRKEMESLPSSLEIAHRDGVCVLCGIVVWRRCRSIAGARDNRNFINSR
jgi:hypothetical protein